MIWTRFDDGEDWVVYHPGSGDVHLVTSSARVLWALASDGRPRSLDALVSALAAETGHPVDAELSDVTKQTLDFMDRAGLLVPLSS